MAASNEQQPKVGFAGLGIMGLAMARNLIKAGYPVTVWNRSSSKCEQLQSEGAQVAPTAKALAEQCEIVLAMVADPEAALQLATGPDGIAAGMGAGKGYVDASTIDAGTAQKINEAITASGAQYLEAPVSGSKQPAEQGQLIFLCGGSRELFDKSIPLLEVMGKAQFFLGKVGNGANMKLVVNKLMGSMMVAFSEALALAEVSGLQQKDVGPSMVEQKFPTAFPLKHQQKDMRLALELGKQHGLTMPVAEAANDMYIKAKEGGQADADFSAVFSSVLQQVQHNKNNLENSH
eukprot:jgi/Astpho2/9194/Aster-07153